MPVCGPRFTRPVRRSPPRREAQSTFSESSGELLNRAAAARGFLLSVLRIDSPRGRSQLMNESSRIDEISERMLVVQAQVRDPAAFRELVTRYERRLAYYIRRMIGETSDAFDVLQDVWLLVFRKLPALEAPEAFRVWLYKIAHDVTISRLRKSTRQIPSIPEETIAGEPDDWNEFEAFERVELVHRMLEKLSPPHREVLALRFLEGLELNEIADIVGCEAGTVKSRLHYAKESLRQQIEGEGHG
jgi:RNA polymerase sigma-70 factor, ECF subfamily